MVTSKPTYQIREDRYDRYWDEETVVLYSGAMEEQMKNLFDTLKKRDKRGARSIRIYLVDKAGNTIDLIGEEQ